RQAGRKRAASAREGRLAGSGGKCATRFGCTLSKWRTIGVRAGRRRSGDDLIEKMTPCAVLDLDDPRVGVEAQFPREAFLDLGLRSGLFAEAAAERPIRRSRVLEYALRRGTEQLRGAVEPVELDENGSGLLGSTPSYCCKSSFQVAAADIGCDPDCRFQAHSNSRSSCRPTQPCSIYHLRGADESRVWRLLR